MTVRPPLVGAALWSAVMKAAGDRCECQGACGKKHDPDRTRQQQRCQVSNGDHVSKVGLIALIAVPRDPINEGDFATAARLPAKRLAAMCRPCHDAVLRKIRSATKKLPAGDDLFNVDEYRVAPPTTGAA
ncbi:hypothetical protein ACFY7H_13275 [Streptomyces sp. NPDC012794]|uniref:hypothetical protein n=1 Tax=Streptomyces sp. NPDC012794 TaxID=3364850 RepID=UPI0036B67AB1